MRHWVTAHALAAIGNGSRSPSARRERAWRAVPPPRHPLVSECRRLEEGNAGQAPPWYLKDTFTFAR
jgi:hypothetical protein